MCEEELGVDSTAMSLLLDDIHLHVGMDLFRRHLEKFCRRRLEVWRDLDGLDVMHHAILNNNFMVVGSLFALGYFKPPYEVTTSWTYLHLAAVLGKRTVVSLLLQERVYDNRRLVLDWDLFHRVIAPKIEVSQVQAPIVPPTEKEKGSAFLPVDLAARYGHAACVRTILDSHFFHSQPRRHPFAGGNAAPHGSLGATSHLDMACELDSSYALRLLLTDGPETQDARTALEFALRMAKPECVDALLRFGVDSREVFRGMNLYHVLFAYSRSFQETWFESMVAVTSVLLRHGHDVNACRPSRTFPLYSLLRCTRVADMNLSHYVITGLLLLLQAGADPNYDEQLVEMAVQDREHDTAYGRKPYPSALHCLVDTTVGYINQATCLVNNVQHIDPCDLMKFINKCADLLLRHGADASYVGAYSKGKRGNVLHAMCEVAPQLVSTDSSLRLLLLRHGGDPDANVDGRLPLTSYFQAMVARYFPAAAPGGTSAPVVGAATTTLQSAEPTTAELLADVTRACRMIGFMSRRSQLHCLSALRTMLTQLVRSELQDGSAPAGSSSAARLTAVAVVKKGVEELEKHTLAVPSLTRCCSNTLWRACRRHVGNVYKLPGPAPLIKLIVDQF